MRKIRIKFFMVLGEKMEGTLIRMGRELEGGYN